MEVWGRSPQRGRSRAPGQGVRGQAEGFLALDRLQDGQNLPLLGILQTVHNSKKV